MRMLLLIICTFFFLFCAFAAFAFGFNFWVATTPEYQLFLTCLTAVLAVNYAIFIMCICWRRK